MTMHTNGRGSTPRPLDEYILLRLRQRDYNSAADHVNKSCTNYRPIVWDAAFAALHLLPLAPPELVKAAHKTLYLPHHPDCGGNLRAVQEVNAAYDLITKEIR